MRPLSCRTPTHPLGLLPDLKTCRLHPYAALALLSLPLLGSPPRLAAQTAAPARTTHAEPESAPNSVPTYGAVTGHVYLAGSNLPARFVQVALQPINIQSPKDVPGKPAAGNFSVYQTDLNGAFILNRVVPGTYYLVIKSPGTLSPLAAFSLAELQHPDADTSKRIAASVPMVTVAPGTAANVTLTLQPGARLGGIVRFDDGTAFAQAGVSVQRRDTEGKWTSPRASENYAQTDLEGRWEIGGLPDGVYRVHVDLQVQERHQSALLADNSSSWNNTVTSLPIYEGDTVRERDAKTVTLGTAEVREDANITVPVSKMHAVTGAVVDARTGQPVNMGRVTLSFADDAKELASVPIDSDTLTFTFPFVFEGEYKLASKDARTVRFEQGGDGSYDPFHEHRKEVVLRAYSPGELPLIVQGDLNGANLPVTIKSTKDQ